MIFFAIEIELDGKETVPKYPVNLHWRAVYLLVRGFRVEDVARILHVWQAFVKKIRHFCRSSRSVDYPIWLDMARMMDGQLASNFVNKLFKV